GRRRRAAERQTAALGGALEAMVSELRIGAHPVRALTVAAAEAPDVLARVAARASLGGDVPTALTDAAQRSGGPARWRRLAAVWRLADQRGLAVADLMHAAHTDIVERQRHRDAVAAQLAGARATTAILAALPALGIVLGAALGARPLDFLTGPGGWCLLLGVGFLSAGLLWAGRLTDRVLEVS
ncbi:type II secretion system F family protein, partial [Mycolicibacterium brumae]